MSNITLDDIFKGIQYVTNATLYSGILSSTGILTSSGLTGLTGLTTLLTNNLNTGVAGVTSFAMASSAAVFAVLVTVVALYGFDVMARSNTFATSRVSAEPEEGKYFFERDKGLYQGFWTRLTLYCNMVLHCRWTYCKS